jgi:hypothetical protein
MNAKSVLAAVLLIGLGIVFGVILVSSFDSLDQSYALTNPDVVIGVQTTSNQVNQIDPHALSDAFINAAGTGGSDRCQHYRYLDQGFAIGSPLVRGLPSFLRSGF